MKDCTMCNYEYRCDWSKNTNGDCPDYRPDIDALDEMEMNMNNRSTSTKWTRFQYNLIT